MSDILQVQQLRKSYGSHQVLDRLTFTVKRGEIYGLLGHNGAGKSTTIDCVLGFQQYEGHIALLGQDAGKLSKKTFEKIGVQFQQSHYQEKIKVEELCKVTASYYKNAADWRPLLASFGLEGKEKQLVEQLSGGEKQKLSVLLTLIPQPSIIFLDELTTGLDTVARRQVWKTLHKLKEKGITILLTSHYMDEVEALCDRIGILVNGSLKIEGSVQQVVQSSGMHSLEEAYLWYTEEDEDDSF